MWYYYSKKIKTYHKKVSINIWETDPVRRQFFRIIGHMTVAL